MNMKTTNRDDKLKLSGNRCRCGACGEYFNSVAAFDKHRKGKATDRSCVHPLKAGMALNQYGYWVTGLMSPEQLGLMAQKRAAA